MESGREVITGSAIAAVGWETAVAALEAGELPCSGVLRGQMLRLAASIADGTAVDPGSALPGLDEGNIALAAGAVLRAAGHHRCLVTAFGGERW